MKSNALNLEKPCEQVLLVTLDQPKQSNVLNEDMISELQELWETLEIPQKDIRAVILTGSGKNFCAGMDSKKSDLHHTQWKQVISSMLNCRIPILTAINGGCRGNGIDLIIASDLCLAYHQAHFCLEGIQLPNPIIIQLLSKTIGHARTKELILTRRSFTTQEAADWGLLHSTSTQKDLLKKTIQIAQDIIDYDAETLTQITESIRTYPPLRSIEDASEFSE